MNERPTFLGVREVKAQIGALLAAYPELSEDAQLLADSIEGQTDFTEILTQLVRLERSAETMGHAIMDEEHRLAVRRERYHDQRDRFRAMIRQLMETADQRKVVLPVATVSVVNGRPGCVVTDETKLPDDYVEIVRKPIKSLITAALKAGSQVPGAELRNSQPHIMIRT